ncbi:MAG: sulfotransferase domain-containing protein [Alphaproteobacteria bacterium]|nr:sulfotransferase domain-containing protein [Alphaproteobacteria bacterium]
MTVIDINAFNIIFEQIANDGKFEGEQLETLRRLGKTRKAVLLAFPPKAAGTFFRNAVVDAVGGQIVRVVRAQGGRDATPYLPTFIAYYSGALTERTLVGHVHMLALPANRHFLEALDIRPIVMKRSIPDMLASYWDMLDSDESACREGLNCCIPENFVEFSDDAKADFLVDILGPWYANYYSSWLSYAETDPDRVCVLDYRDFNDDAAGTLQQALEHVGLPRSREQCQSVITHNWNNRHQSRFNKGEEGRGGRYFKAPHMHRLTRMLGHYSNLAPHIERLLDTGLEWRATGGN